MTLQSCISLHEAALPKKSLLVVFVATILSIITSLHASAQSIDVTGTWVGSSIAGGSSYPNTFTLVQNGTTVSGTLNPSSPTSGPGIFTGTVNGNILTLRSNYPAIGYSSDSTAVTDGFTMSGSFLDSQGTSGTFTAAKLSGPLTPTTKIEQAPVVQIKAKTASVIMKKFTEVVTAAQFSIVDLERDSKLEVRAAAPLKIQYLVTVKSGKNTLQKASTRNLVTFKNLPPGKYSASYKVSALKGKKVVFTTKKSPAASFTISK